MKKCTAANGRFGVMAAVAPRKVQCKFAREYPAGSLVGAATSPSRWAVVGNVRERGGQNSAEFFSKTDK